MSDSGSTSPHGEVVSGTPMGPWGVRERRDRGSFGLVFRVERAGHPEAGSFALKLALQPEDPRFKREVALLQSLQHPSVPRFEDRGWWTSPRGGMYPYLVMEWVEGVQLYEWARREPRTSSAGFDELLLACLSEDPLRRPPAASLVIALGHAARQAEAAAPIVRAPAEADTGKAGPGPEWLPSAAAAVATLALVVLAGHALLSRDWSGLYEPRGPSPEVPDAGVGDVALTSAEQAPSDLSPIFTLGKKFPHQPFPNQKKPPCLPRAEREVLGACWSILKLEPPCGEELFDRDGECLRPVIVQDRPNRSPPAARLEPVELWDP